MTTFVLVPGAGGSAGYWHLVVDRLERLGHAAVAVDLPGPDPERGLTQYVELIRSAIAAAEPPVVLVAQSMGGFSASWAATLAPVDELVLLNAMIPVPGESAGTWWEATGFVDPVGGFSVEDTFLHDVPLEALVGLDERDEAEIGFSEPWAPEAWPDVPTRVLVGRDDRLFPADFQEKVAWDRLHQDVERIPGGHLAALSRPDELVAALTDPSHQEH